MAFGCATNLTDANVVRRLRWGILMLATGLLVAVWLKASGAGHGAWLLVPFALLFAAANFFFQAMYMTCGYSAISGVRHTGLGTERIADRGELRSVRIRGAKQIVLAFVCASLLSWVMLLR
jgi:hypothetical protein